MAVKLTNVARPPRPITFNLDHPAHKDALRYLRAVEGKRGETVFSRETKIVTQSLTLMARGTKGSSVVGLPDTILECPDVKAAVNARQIQAEQYADPSPAERAARKSASAPRTETSSGSESSSDDSSESSSSEETSETTSQASESSQSPPEAENEHRSRRRLGRRTEE